MTRDAAHWLRRSEQEAVRSIQAPEQKVAAIHQELCLLCVGQALSAMLAARCSRAAGAGLSCS